MKKLSKKEKILLCTSIIGIGVAGYFGCKYINSEKSNKELEVILNSTKNDNDELKQMINTLMEAASEGVFEEAISTVNNKINHRSDKRKYLLEALKLYPDDKQSVKALIKVNIELKNLYIRKEKFTNAQALYEIKDEI